MCETQYVTEAVTAISEAKLKTGDVSAAVQVRCARRTEVLGGLEYDAVLSHSSNRICIRVATRCFRLGVNPVFVLFVVRPPIL